MALTPTEFFAAADALPFASLAEIAGDSGVLVVAPHPDDESLGCGGLLAFCAREGRPAHVIVISDGTGSHPNSTKYPAQTLRDLREAEARAAVDALGFAWDAITFLRLPDRSVPRDGEDAQAAVERIIGQARAIGAGTIFVTWRGDPHCDHEASFHLARNAAAQIGAKLVEYPVWGHTLPADTRLEVAPRGVRLDVLPVLDRKRAAIAAHRSQMTGLIDDDPFGFALSAEMVARFERPFEIFLESE